MFEPRLPMAGVMMETSTVQRTISPIDGSLVATRTLAAPSAVDRILAAAARARTPWARLGLEQRSALVAAMVDAFVVESETIATSLTTQMGRPIRFSALEVRGFAQRARHMIDIAPAALAPIRPDPTPGFERYILREPLGTVLVLAPWNYPLLTAVNAVVPALLAGNVVILKHSDQTPLCAEQITAAGARAGLPEGVLQHLHVDHDTVARMVGDPRVDHVCFTGSVAGGLAVQQAAARRFIGVGLELGGKDPAYVRPDADLAFAAENIVEGVLFNSGQSCCGIERIYVHQTVYDEFIERAVAAVGGWTVGDPRDPEVMLGPVARARNARAIDAQVHAAIGSGARPLIATAALPGPAWVHPQLLADVDHTMEVMREETFGPVAGIMAVGSDEEALRLMNDSQYGLTASVWTEDTVAATELAHAIDAGTVFMNRCDYLDPALAWTGRKASGRGVTLSRLGFEHLTRAKSFHLRTRHGGT